MAAKKATAKKATAKKAESKKAESKTTAPAKASTHDIAGLWTRIEGWFAKNHPELSLGLLPGATAEAITAAEKKLGVSLPADFRASLLVHDGQVDSPGVQLFPVAQRLGSLASLVGCWTDDRDGYDESEMAERFDWLDDSERVRQVQLHPKHIPIAGSPYWDYDRLMLDFIPGPEGSAGQVIARDDIELEYLCTTFGDLLARTAQALEDGTAVVTKSTYASELGYRAPNGKKAVDHYDFFRSSR